MLIPGKIGDFKTFGEGAFLVGAKDGWRIIFHIHDSSNVNVVFFSDGYDHMG